MVTADVNNALIDEIELFIDYSVSDDGKQDAKALVRKYEASPIALAVLKEFYMVLPEVREEGVERISLLETTQGVVLLVISTANHSYITVVSEGNAHILGEYKVDELPKELLNFFGYATNDEFLKGCKEVKELPVYGEKGSDKACPGCNVEVGEIRLLGCPVEVCPWCDGQLSRCNCRFEKLDVEEITEESQLEEFQELLESEGRIPYKPEQGPSYPGTSEGLDKGRKT